VRPAVASSEQPNVLVATGRGDTSVGMVGEIDPALASLAEALYWRNIYLEVERMGVSVLERVEALVAGQPADVRRGVDLGSVLNCVTQIARCRSRLHLWDLRVETISTSHRPATRRLLPVSRQRVAVLLSHPAP
jgi:hypothetical protein